MTTCNFDDPYEFAEWVAQRVKRIIASEQNLRRSSVISITDYDIREIDRQVNAFIFTDPMEAKSKAKELKNTVERYGSASVMDFCSITGSKPDDAREEEILKRIGWADTDDIGGVSYDYRKNGYIIRMGKIKRLKGENGEAY